MGLGAYGPAFNSSTSYLTRNPVGSVALLVARRTNDRKVAGSRPTKVVCITVSTGNRMGVNCPLWPAATPSSELYEVGVQTVSVDGLGSGMGKW